MALLVLDKVVKHYQQHCAVDNVSFEVPEGAIFGLLGPNGAGKTSLIRIITTITRADSGVVYFNGEPLNSGHPALTGYMPEERGLYRKMKVGEELMYLAQLRGMSYQEAQREVSHWLTKFEIRSWHNKKVEELSKGMQQKVQFIATVLHKPKLLILDEPFTGLDPINASLIQAEIMEMHRQGTTIIFSTHRMEQVEEICDQIVLINKGKNILQGNVTNIRNQYKENLFKIDFQGTLPTLQDITIQQQSLDSVIVRLQEGQTPNALLQQCLQQGTQIKAFNEILPTLNDIFIRKVTDNNE